MNSLWCMEFSNDEIRKYLICELERSQINCSCMIDDEYVDKYSNKNFEYITFDGEKQDFFISFYGCETSIFIYDYKIMFIDDNEKNFYTIEDTYDNIVYEGKLSHLTHEEIFKKLVSVIKLLYGCKKLTVSTQKSLNQNTLYPCFEYKLMVENSFVQNGIYKFDNITIEVYS